MPNYKNGKIYSIRSYSRPDLIYVGSTTQLLSIRFGKHKVSNNTTSNQIIKIGDAYIELIENYSCNSRNELNKREGEIIRSMDCVNKLIAGRTRKEYYNENIEELRQKDREYKSKNQEKIKKYREDNKEKMKQYRKDNSIKANDRSKLHYIKNKEYKLNYQKQYKEDNKLKLKQKIDCDCGGKYTYKGKSKHFITAKHKLYQETYDYIYK